MRRFLPLGVLLMGSLAFPAAAQDVELMARWTAIPVVRYAVVGQFNGQPEVMRGSQGFSRQGQVTDRVELTFDWNQNETALVGTPTVRNFPSSISVIEAPGCPATRVNGAYEFLEIASVAQMSSVLQVTGTRRFPGGAIPFPGDDAPCGAGWDEAAAKSEAVEMMLVVPPTVYFGMPSAALGAGTSISEDGKSIILVDEANGWTWTFTPTPVN
ncbi:MAG TPA: hypothetical protein VFJ45_10995 [bacterium]|nr:hypothetical protein [bacterium]